MSLSDPSTPNGQSRHGQPDVTRSCVGPNLKAWAHLVDQARDVSEGARRGDCRRPLSISTHRSRLVLAFLELREQRWTRDFVEAEAIRRGSNPEERLLAIFDAFDEWFSRDDFEALGFVDSGRIVAGPSNGGDAQRPWVARIAFDRASQAEASLRIDD